MCDVWLLLDWRSSLFGVIFVLIVCRSCWHFCCCFLCVLVLFMFFMCLVLFPPCFVVCFWVLGFCCFFFGGCDWLRFSVRLLCDVCCLLCVVGCVLLAVHCVLLACSLCVV